MWVNQATSWLMHALPAGRLLTAGFTHIMPMSAHRAPQANSFLVGEDVFMSVPDELCDDRPQTGQSDLGRHHGGPIVPSTVASRSKAAVESKWRGPIQVMLPGAAADSRNILLRALSLSPQSGGSNPYSSSGSHSPRRREKVQDKGLHNRSCTFRTGDRSAALA